MDYVDLIMAKVNQMKVAEFAGKPIKVLGEVILLLEAQPQDNVIKLDFTGCNPAGLCSYRGYYSDLCLNYDLEAEPMTVAKLLELFKGSDGRIYEGYKGGNYRMNRKTLVWVAPYGECGKMLTDIKSNGRTTTIYTQEDTT